MPDHLEFYDVPADSAVQYFYRVAPDLVIKERDSFEITVHGVDGISLKIHSPSIDRLELKIKLLKLTDAVNRYLSC